MAVAIQISGVNLEAIKKAVEIYFDRTLPLYTSNYFHSNSKPQRST